MSIVRIGRGLLCCLLLILLHSSPLVARIADGDRSTSRSPDRVDVQPTADSPDTSQTVWRAVLFDGLKAGWASSERKIDENGILTRERMVLEIQRAGVQVRLESLEETLEAGDGTPLRFLAEQQASDQRTRYEGTRRADGHFDVVSEVGGEQTSQVLELTSDALFFEGQRRAIVDSGMTAGSVVEFHAFQPLMLASVRVRTEIHATAPTEVLTQDLELIQVLQQIYYSDRPIEVLAAVDASFEPQRISMDLQGMQIVMVTCNRECALAPSQAPEFLNQLLIPAPASSRHSSAIPVRYQLAGASLAELPQTGHQRQQQGWLLVEPRARAASASELPDLARQLEATPWLQSDHPEIKALASRALGPADDPAASRMQAAEDFVRGYINGKTLSVGYASALEVSRNRRGDCTEHALLLAALGRAEGIPTRVMTGFARVPRFGDQTDVFVPHAWTEAFIDGAWQGFDAALNGFGSGHIALVSGDGDPTRFYATLELLTSLQVTAAEPVETER